MISTAAAPSVICDELPAVTRPPPPVRNDGFSLASVSTVVSRRPSSAVIIAPVGAEHRQDLALEPALVGGPRGVLLAAGAERVEVLAGEVPLVGDHLGGDALRHEPALRRRSGRRPSGPNGKPNLPSAIEAPIGTRVITSTPAATTTS